MAITVVMIGWYIKRKRNAKESVLGMITITMIINISKPT